MAFPQAFLDEVLARSDIFDVVSGYVHLTKKGGSYFGLCPFHNERTGSFSVSPDKQLYYCFGCKKGGGVVNFIMELEGLSYPEAVRFLAKRAGVPVPEEVDQEEGRRRRRLLELNRTAARYFHDNLKTPQGAPFLSYLQQRRISRRTAVNFGLGASLDSWDALTTAMTGQGFSKAELLASGLVVQSKQGRLYDKFRGRLMFPVIDVSGNVVAFGGRVLDKSEPKYMNSPETPVYAKRRNLYGINLAKKTKRPNFILCEGNIDVITLHQAGFDNAVASMGTALTTEQIRLLGRYTKELVLCYDNDGAGKAATEKAIELLQNSEFTVRVLQIPNKLVDGAPVKQDVDDYIKTCGPPAFSALLDGSGGHLDYQLTTLAARYDLTDDQQKVSFAQAASALLAGLSNAVEREIYAGRAAELSGISREALLLEVRRAAGRRQSRERRQEVRESLQPAAARQPKERAFRYDDPRSAQAEEGVLQLLLLDEGLFAACDLAPEEFSSPMLAGLYRQMLQWRQEGRTVSPAALTAVSEPAVSEHLARILQRPVTLANAPQAMEVYIGTIRAAYQIRQGDPLLAAKDIFKNKKGYGGKQRV